MPIYGYRCSQCGHELEVFQSMSAEPLRVCPECGGALSKMLYPVGIQFKGSGFYSTDYKNGGSSSKGAGSADGASDRSSSEGSSSTSSSDSEKSSSDGGSSSGSSEKKTETVATKD
jgi:putative FmdB family regulatory protein